MSSCCVRVLVVLALVLPLRAAAVDGDLVQASVKLAPVGIGAGNELGSAIALAGNLDGAGGPDLVVGAWKDNAVHVLFLDTDGSLLTRYEIDALSIPELVSACGCEGAHTRARPGEIRSFRDPIRGRRPTSSSNQGRLRARDDSKPAWTKRKVTAMKLRYDLFDAVLYFAYTGLVLLAGGLIVA